MKLNELRGEVASIQDQGKNLNGELQAAQSRQTTLEDELKHVKDLIVGCEHNKRDMVQTIGKTSQKTPDPTFHASDHVEAAKGLANQLSIKPVTHPAKKPQKKRRRKAPRIGQRRKQRRKRT